MPNRRIFVDTALEAGREVRLGSAAAAHVRRVLRLGPGAALTLFDGRGGEYPATLLAARGTVVLARTGTRRAIERESPLDLTLVQGISRGERMDWVVQKATELGVARIAPVLTERSVVKLDDAQAERKRRHWRAVAIAGCEQSGRNRVPDILAPLNLAVWLEAQPPAPSPCTGHDPGPRRLLLDPGASQELGRIDAATALTLLIGPEGGLTETECALAGACGFVSVRLGPRVLRTETAALAALAVLQARCGDL